MTVNFKTKSKPVTLVAMGDCVLCKGKVYTVGGIFTQYGKHSGKHYIVHFTDGQRKAFKLKETLEVIL